MRWADLDLSDGTVQVQHGNTDGVRPRIPLPARSRAILAMRHTMASGVVGVCCARQERPYRTSSVKKHTALT